MYRPDPGICRIAGFLMKKTVLQNQAKPMTCAVMGFAVAWAAWKDCVGCPGSFPPHPPFSTRRCYACAYPGRLMKAALHPSAFSYISGCVLLLAAHGALGLGEAAAGELGGNVQRLGLEHLKAGVGIVHHVIERSDGFT